MRREKTRKGGRRGEMREDMEGYGIRLQPDCNIRMNIKDDRERKGKKRGGSKTTEQNRIEKK